MKNFYLIVILLFLSKNLLAQEGYHIIELKQDDKIRIKRSNIEVAEIFDNRIDTTTFGFVHTGLSNKPRPTKFNNGIESLKKYFNYLYSENTNKEPKKVVFVLNYYAVKEAIGFSEFAVDHFDFDFCIRDENNKLKSFYHVDTFLTARSGISDLTSKHAKFLAEILYKSCEGADLAYANRATFDDVFILEKNKPVKILSDNFPTDSIVQIYYNPFAFLAQKSHPIFPNYRTSYTDSKGDVITMFTKNIESEKDFEIFAISWKSKFFINYKFDSDKGGNRFIKTNNGKYLLHFSQANGNGMNGAMFGIVGAIIDAQNVRKEDYLIDLENFNVIDIDDFFIQSLVNKNIDLKEELSKRKIKIKKSNWFDIINTYNELWYSKNNK